MADRWLIDGSFWGSASIYKLIKVTPAMVVVVDSYNPSKTRRINKSAFMGIAHSEEEAKQRLDAFRAAYESRRNGILFLEAQVLEEKRLQRVAMREALGVMEDDYHD